MTQARSNNRNEKKGDEEALIVGKAPSTLEVSEIQSVHPTPYCSKDQNGQNYADDDSDYSKDQTIFSDVLLLAVRTQSDPYYSDKQSEWKK
jgi:hypothetical protein